MFHGNVTSVNLACHYFIIGALQESKDHVFQMCSLQFCTPHWCWRSYIADTYPLWYE